MKDRLAKFMELEGFTSVKFAEIMEVQPSSISHLLSGRNKPNFEFISRLLLRFPDLSPDWIINGIGEIYKSNQMAQSIEVTDVIRGNITTVNCGSGAIKKINIPTENTLFNISKVADKEEDKLIENEVTNGTIEVKTSVEKSESKNTSLIDRIVILYTDGSFEEYHND